MLKMFKGVDWIVVLSLTFSLIMGIMICVFLFTAVNYVCETGLKDIAIQIWEGSK